MTWVISARRCRQSSPKAAKCRAARCKNRLTSPRKSAAETRSTLRPRYSTRPPVCMVQTLAQLCLLSAPGRLASSSHADLCSGASSGNIDGVSRKRDGKGSYTDAVPPWKAPASRPFEVHARHGRTARPTPGAVRLWQRSPCCRPTCEKRFVAQLLQVGAMRVWKEQTPATEEPKDANSSDSGFSRLRSSRMPRG